MSVTVSKADGATVLTVVSDPNGHLPPLCQILKALCHSLAGCSVPPHLKRVRRASLLVLGTVQIMVGVLNIGLGPGRTSTRLGDFTSLGAAYWLGAVFVVTGIMTVLAGRFPSSCLVGFTVFLNIVGAIFSITGIVFYAIDLNNSSLLWVCDRSGSDPDRYDDSCRNMAAFDQVSRSRLYRRRFSSQLCERSGSSQLLLKTFQKPSECNTTNKQAVHHYLAT
uniref:Uncharacterized protein n=1 Tax=Poecilia latipinna TaxID=48699 RepID=A0A3B3VDH9_9TELE